MFSKVVSKLIFNKRATNKLRIIKKELQEHSIQKRERIDWLLQFF